ncbi:uncharacterized protein LOC124936906 [Impatiens glandulifera]|uniref:uncharacterized protein LOC124936906 n=1 Tax=Impatiens glandulifera TaxID=253017 RepID=UPI001FB15DC7|nr:uncharacterized protein LOC124936906 [Impatiens glandulifera]
MSGEVSDYVMQGYLEQCIKRHMSLNETKNTLWLKAKINPAYTELAWKQLDKANPAFFKAYHYRLLVKDQIVRFNQLLERQVELVTSLSTEPTTVDMSNGSDIPPNSDNESMGTISERVEQ